MGDEIDARSRFQTLPADACDDILWVLRTVYGGGYVNRKLSWEQLKRLRGKSYRTLKALGVEK